MSMKSVIDWRSVTESLPEEGERVLVSTPSSILFGTLAGIREDRPPRPGETVFYAPPSPVFVDSDHFMIGGVKYWAKLPPLPQPTRN